MSEYVVDFSKVATNTTGELEGFDRSRATLMFLVREEIVRCRDCKRYHAEVEGCEEFAGKWPGEFANVDPDGYCSWAERRDA